MIAIIQYNAGNIKSVQNALNRLGCESLLTDDFDEIRRADKVIFPGVGEASSAMNYLRERKLDQLIPSLKQPVLGICLGLQLLCHHSEEADTMAMGVFDAGVKKIPPTAIVPHTGWNNTTAIKGLLMKGVPDTSDFYFVHSYYAEICKHTTAVCNYNIPFSAALEKDNFYAVQFHPEKSAAAGEQVLKNFLAL
jgi:imidazole glycerol-phosphate synthase subunit HisH